VRRPSSLPQARIKDLLRRVEVFADCDAEDLAVLAESCALGSAEPGEAIVIEGDEAKSFFVLTEGEVVILCNGAEEYELGRMVAPHHFGEAALAGSSKRSATLRAIETTQFIEIDTEAMLSLARTRPGFATSLVVMLRGMFTHLERSTTVAVQQLDQALQESRMRNRISRFIMMMILGLTGYSVFLGLVVGADEFIAKSEFISVPMLFVSFVIMVWFMRTSGFPARFFGFNFDNWKRHALEGVLFTVPPMLITVAVKLFLISGTDAPVFDLFPGDGTIATISPALIAAYVLFVPAQELTCRGALQSTLEAFLTSKHRKIEANIAANAVFLIAHLYISYALSAIAFMCGLYWGWLYSRQRSLVGVVVSHILLGLFAFEVVGLPGIQ